MEPSEDLLLFHGRGIRPHRGQGVLSGCLRPGLTFIHLYLASPWSGAWSHGHIGVSLVFGSRCHSHPQGL